MGYIKVDDENSQSIKLYYEDHGTGQPIVLIHGYPLSSVAWERQLMPLLDAGYRTITYDRRGFGKSSQPATGYDYDTFAADLSTIIMKLDLRDVILVGHSMGAGEVARYIGTFTSERVSKAVFISPIPPYLLKTDDNPAGVDQKIFDDIMQAIAKDRFAYQSQFLSNFFNLDVTLDKQISEDAVQANWNLAASASPIATAACVPTWLTDFRDDVEKIDVPVLIIQGDADRVLPFPSSGQLLHATLEGSKLVVLEGAPHGIPWTHADEINRELLDFIRS
jgi:non-heme chloroperoxidase